MAQKRTVLAIIAVTIMDLPPNWNQSIETMRTDNPYAEDARAPRSMGNLIKKSIKLLFCVIRRSASQGVQGVFRVIDQVFLALCLTRHCTG